MVTEPLRAGESIGTCGVLEIARVILEEVLDAPEVIPDLL